VLRERDDTGFVEHGASAGLVAGFCASGSRPVRLQTTLCTTSVASTPASMLGIGDRMAAIYGSGSAPAAD